MNVFDLDNKLVNDYKQFARSFTLIRALDIQAQINQLYDSGHFWPEPRISINPHFETGKSIAELVADKTLHPATAEIFRIDGSPLR